MVWKKCHCRIVEHELFIRTVRGVQALGREGGGRERERVEREEGEKEGGEGAGLSGMREERETEMVHSRARALGLCGRVLGRMLKNRVMQKPRRHSVHLPEVPQVDGLVGFCECVLVLEPELLARSHARAKCSKATELGKRGLRMR